MFFYNGVSINLYTSYKIRACVNYFGCMGLTGEIKSSANDDNLPHSRRGFDESLLSALNNSHLTENRSSC